MAASTKARDTSERFSNKVTIVTGGSRGIGEAIVRTFVKHGSKVVFCSNENECGPKLERELNEAYPGSSNFFLCDLTKEEDIKNLIHYTIEKHNKIDCLINNAGWHPPYHTIDEFTAQGFRDLLNLNVVAYFLTAKYALPHIRQVAGCIINNASMVAHLGQKHSVTYVASKGAVISMTKAMAVDEAAHNVRVNSVSISNVITPLWEEPFPNLSEEQKRKRIEAGRDAQVLGRFGTYEEVGLTFLFLAADATFCTGTDIKFSGGCELNYGKKTQVGRGEDADIFE